MSARGNRGPGLTGSNGNAGTNLFISFISILTVKCEGNGNCETLIVGPVNAAGQAYDPAAETYKKQVTHLL